MHDIRLPVEQGEIADMAKDCGDVVTELSGHFLAFMIPEESRLTLDKELTSPDECYRTAAASQISSPMSAELT